jgi:hypothetical protein
MSMPFNAPVVCQCCFHLLTIPPSFVHLWIVAMELFFWVAEMFAQRRMGKLNERDYLELTQS